MTTTIGTKLLAPTLLALSTTTIGCAAYRLDPPVGFAEVEQSEYGAHMKANNDVGLRVNVFHNVRGGTLAFWSLDLVEKLGARGYTLRNQAAAESSNGVVGTRFDFAYTPVGKDPEPRFYTVVLFVSDEHRVVLGVAGGEEYRERYSQEVDTIVGDLKVRGCKIASKICKGPQPERLSTPTPAAAADDDGEPEPASKTGEPEASEAEAKPTTA